MRISLFDLPPCVGVIAETLDLSGPQATCVNMIPGNDNADEPGSGYDLLGCSMTPDYATPDP